MQKGQWYVFNLSVPTGVDYDLHLYNYTPTEWGEPDLIISSKSPIEGKNEIINYTAEYTGRYFLVAKAIGEPLLPAAAEKDDDNGGGEDEMTILEFLLSPLGLLIIGSCVAAVLIIITILIKKTVIKKRDDYKFSNIN